MDKYIIETMDGEEIEIDRNFIDRSETLKNMIQDMNDEFANILIPNITSNIIMEIKNVLSQGDRDDLPIYPKDFETLIELTKAFNYLDMPADLHKICKYHALILSNKTPEEIRQLYDLPDDLTHEEKEQIKKENSWAISEN